MLFDFSKITRKDLPLLLSFSEMLSSGYFVKLDVEPYHNASLRIKVRVDTLVISDEEEPFLNDFLKTTIWEEKTIVEFEEKHQAMQNWHNSYFVINQIFVGAFKIVKLSHQHMRWDIEEAAESFEEFGDNSY